MVIKIHEAAGVSMDQLIKSSQEMKIVPPLSSRASDMQGSGAAAAADSRLDYYKLDDKIPRHHKILTSLIAGAVAGAVAKTTIAPLDRTKIHFQISTDKRYSLRGAVRFLIRSFKADGFLALWRGNSATMARIIPFAAIQYASHEEWKHLLNPTNQRDLPPLRRYLAGSLAGVTASCLTYPLDLARARMAVTKKCQYNTLLEVFLKIYRMEGIRTLYSGFTPALDGVIPYAGTSFYTYESLKKWHREYTGEHDPSHMLKLCFGAVAGLLGQSASYPLDIVRRRMQTSGVKGMSDIYTSITATLLYVYRTEGVTRGLYKGLSMNWIKGPVAVGVSFTVFEFVKLQLRKVPVFHDVRYQSADKTK